MRSGLKYIPCKILDRYHVGFESQDVYMSDEGVIEKVNMESVTICLNCPNDSCDLDKIKERER